MADLKGKDNLNNQEIKIWRGCPLPIGPSITRTGINFSVFSRHATSVTVVLFPDSNSNPRIEVVLDPRYNKTGDIWHVHITGLNPGIEYGFRMDQKPARNKKIHKFNKNIILIDPYAKALSGGDEWGKQTFEEHGRENGLTRKSLVIQHRFAWDLDQPLNIPPEDSIIYELHVRGFTRHPSSGAKEPGTFSGLIEKIPYLKDLGVTAVELLPINEFDETHEIKKNPFTGASLFNFWGYDSICFYAPKASYAANNKNGNHLNEFKSLVKALHDEGIEVILDIVFNHTAEGGKDGPTFSFRGLDNSIYYMTDKDTGNYYNFSGCGNTLNCNHPVVRDLIMDCLRYWVIDMHIDGFRFDLASILGRGQDGSVLANPPLLEQIANDPVLAHTKIIAEAWDAAGLYQVGSFPSWQRWAEWNGQYRDDLRRYVRGDKGLIPILATRIAGSSDLYRKSGRAPYHSINFITCHDGFTLNDLVSYNKKHNEINGEGNRDGTNENYSWNCGKEGLSNSEKIVQLRKKQIKNFTLLLLLSQGVPMILAGDEMGRTQKGNNNAYCQDNEISWIDWNLLQQNADLFRFFKLAIQFRKDHKSLRRTTFFEDDPAKKIFIQWHGTKLYKPDWSGKTCNFAFHLLPNPHDSCDIYVISNANARKQNFQLPKLRNGKKWYRVVDTALQAPLDFLESGQEQLLANQNSYTIQARTTALLIALSSLK
jgi:glycogen operon protein